MNNRPICINGLLELLIALSKCTGILSGQSQVVNSDLSISMSMLMFMLMRVLSHPSCDEKDNYSMSVDSSRKNVNIRSIQTDVFLLLDTIIYIL